MLEQIKNPCSCFKDVSSECTDLFLIYFFIYIFLLQIIHTHFWLKRQEICNQIQDWITELSKPQHSRQISLNSMVLRRQYRQLREELAKLPVPEGLEDLDRPFAAAVSSPTNVVAAAGGNNCDAANNVLVAGGSGDGGSIVGGGSTNNTVVTPSSGASSSVGGLHEENSTSSDSTIPSIQIDANDPLIISITDIL